MKKSRKRKLAVAETQHQYSRYKRAAGSSKPITTAVNDEPFPLHSRPTPEECRALRDDLLKLHGFPRQFLKYRTLREKGLDQKLSSNSNKFQWSRDDDGGPEESVLDGLVSTILSQNTTELNSQRAFDNLKAVFPTWEDVLAAETRSVESAIRCGGLAVTKASCIKNILSNVFDKKGKLCLEYLRDLSIDEIKRELSNFKGLGPKTMACVLMFHLQRDDFPVDTHIHQIAKTMGWVPVEADVKKTYLHLNRRIPDELKFDLNCLLFTHGKLCNKCSMKRSVKEREESQSNFCPILDYRENSVLRLTMK